MSKSTAKVAPKQDTLVETLDSTEPSASSQPDSESQGITPELLKNLKIPRKNDKETSVSILRLYVGIIQELDHFLYRLSPRCLLKSLQ